VYVVIRRKEKEIRERQELSEAHRKKKKQEGKKTFKATGVQEVSACGQKTSK